MKSSDGCWTCRLRRKKCDEKKPICSACTTLHIQCYYYPHNDKPHWMDGGVKQAKKSEQIKREIKVVKAHRRLLRGNQSISRHRESGEFMILSPLDTSEGLSPIAPIPSTTKEHVNSEDSTFQVSTYSPNPRLGNQDHNVRDGLGLPVLEGSDIVLTSFYLDKVLPFLFPFYAPPLSKGGKAWILELILKRRPIRQAILCQSRYFSSICGTGPMSDGKLEEVLAQTKSSVFQILREGLRHIVHKDAVQDPRGAVRVMTCIMQLYRLEIAILSFENWQTHLDAVVRLFKQLLDNHRDFKTIVERLGSPSASSTIQNTGFPSAEQAAFNFSSSLVIMDDIIASATLRRQPKLYSHHRSLLCRNIEDRADPLIDMEAVLGIKNNVLLQLGEIAALNAWKIDRRKAGNLDIIQLAHRASIIRESLIVNFTELKNTPTDSFIQSQNKMSSFDVQSDHRRVLNTRIWTHAALLFLFAVTSGWQPANEDVQHHVSQVIELLNCGSFQPELSHTAVWPFCVAGCLAAPAQESQFRQMVQGLELNLFGKMHRALEIMENVWKDRSTGNHDLGTYFKSLEDPVLLV